MTFLEFCEEVNGKPFNKFEQDYINKFEEIMKSGEPVIFVTGRGQTKQDSRMFLKILYDEYLKIVDSKEK